MSLNTNPAFLPKNSTENLNFHVPKKINMAYNIKNIETNK